MDSLIIDLIRAAQNKDFDVLESLLDEHHPNLACDSIKTALPDYINVGQVVAKEDLSTDTLQGSFPAQMNGYQIAAQTLKTDLGDIAIYPTGEYTFKVTKADVLRRISNVPPMIIGGNPCEDNLSFSDVTCGVLTLVIGKDDVHKIEGLNFSTTNDLTEIASIIKQAINSSSEDPMLADATVSFDGSTSRFKLKGGVIEDVTLSVLLTAQDQLADGQIDVGVLVGFISARSSFEKGSPCSLYNLSTTVDVTYRKEAKLPLVMHQLITRACAGAPCSTVKKLLDLGCCPNSNTHEYERLSQGMRAAKGMTSDISPSQSKEANPIAIKKKIATREENKDLKSESRPLINAIKGGCKDVAQILIDHQCPCCNGKGAQITDKILEVCDKAKNAAGIHIKSLVS